MSKYETLTRYLSMFSDDIGVWVGMHDTDEKTQMQLSFVVYSETVHRFKDAVLDFVTNNEDMGLNHYYDILAQNGLEWGMQSMSEADVTNLDVRCVLALIVGAVRAERFCDGALLSFFENGCIHAWLKRLQEIEIEEQEDAYLLQVAEAALEEHRNNPKTYTFEETMAALGISQEDLDAITPEELDAFCKGE